MRRVFRWAGRKEGLGGSRMHACMSMLKQVYRKPHVYCKHIHHKILVHHKVYTHSAHNPFQVTSIPCEITSKKTKISGIQKKNLPTDLSNQAVSSFLIRLYSPPSTPSIKPQRNATFPAHPSHTAPTLPLLLLLLLLLPLLPTLALTIALFLHPQRASRHQTLRALF